MRTLYCSPVSTVSHLQAAHSSQPYEELGRQNEEYTMKGTVVGGYRRRVVRFWAASTEGHFLPHESTRTLENQSKGSCGKSCAWGGHEAMPHGELHQVLRTQRYADIGQWWTHRCCKTTPRHADLRHRKFTAKMLLKNRHLPAWADSQSATVDLGSEAAPGTEPTMAQGPENCTAISGHFGIATCRKLCDDGVLTDAVDALGLLVQRGCHLPNNLFYRVLKRCIQDKNLVLGKRIHALAVTGGYKGDAFLATHLIGLYALNGRLEEAMEVFLDVSTPNTHNWATIILAYARHGEAAKAVQLYRQMCQLTTIRPDNRLYSAVLKACAAARDLVAGKEVHAHVLASSLEPDRFVEVGLMNMYAKCGSLEIARSLFDKLSDRNVVTWNAMIAGYAQHGMGSEALSLYRCMRQEGASPPNCATYASLLQACATIKALDEGEQLHAEIESQGLQKDLVVSTSLVNMYAKCGKLDIARRLFDKLSERNIVAYNAMIAGYAQQGLSHEAFNFYRSMQREGLVSPDFVTYVGLLQACATAGVQALDEGKQLHRESEERGLQERLCTSLLNMYAKCGSLEDARRLFDKHSGNNRLAWNAMIAGYSQRGLGEQALILYRQMQQKGLTPDSVTFVCLLQACASAGVGALHEGKQLHAEIEKQGLQKDSVLGRSLVNMYAKCGSLGDAREQFDKLSERNIIAWNAMIGGYALQGMSQEALDLYSRMRREGVSPDSVTYLCLLQACAAVAGLSLGEKLHMEIEERGIQVDNSVGAALVHMYAKCGSMHDSQRVFDSLSGKGIEAWGALVNGYARQGNSRVVFEMLEKMRREGLHPDELTLLSVLTVCSHVGLVDKGQEYFEAMTVGLGITATIEHFVCMVDLLGRAGRLDEALQVAKTMPFASNGVVWRTLLGACQKWKNVEVGQQAFRGAVSLDENDAASYVLMANIYASNQMWEAAKEMQARRKQLKAWKKPGQSWWTDIRGVVHTYIVGANKELR